MIKKKPLAKIAALTCVALVLLTFVSRTVYSMSLAGVKTTVINSGLITASAQVKGMIEYTDTISVVAGDNWTVDSVLVKDGQYVNKGDLLLTTDKRDWEMGKRQAELDILRLENDLAALNDLYVTAETMELYAPFDGRLVSAERVLVGREIKQDAYLGRYVDDNAFTVSVNFIEAYKDKIQTGMTASVTLPSWMLTVEGTITAVAQAASVAEGVRVITVDVRIGNPGALSEGEIAVADVTTDSGEVLRATGPGKLRYADEVLLYAPMSGNVTACLLETDARFLKGALMLAIEEEAASVDEQAVMRSRAEIGAQLDIARRQLERYSGPYGALLAETDGYIGNVSVKNGERPPAGEELLCVYPDGAQPTVKFSLPLEQGKDYGVGASVSVKYYVMEDDNVIERSCFSSVSERKLSDDRLYFEFNAPIEGVEEFLLSDITADIKVERDGAIYDVVIPASCVSDRGGSKTVFALSKRNGLFGVEYYVVEYKVEVIGGNAYYAALEPGLLYTGMEIVVYASRPLSGGEVVKTIEP